MKSHTNLAITCRIFLASSVNCDNCRNRIRAEKPLSVKMELQADCFAGIWAHSTQQRGLLEQGDIESALGAASAVGDDRLQKMATGHVNADSFTHGSSEQRTMWFRKGLDSGSISTCNTFAQ